MKDASFDRLVHGAQGKPLNPSDLSVRVLWFEQRDRYLKFLADKSLKNLKRVFNILGKAENVDSLRLDLEADIPFAGDMFSRTTLGHNISVGAEALFLSHGGLSLSDGVVIGQKALLITLGHPLHPIQRHLHKIGPIDVGSGVLLGESVIIVNSGRAEPVTIGKGTIVLPGTVITKNIPSYCVVGGVNKILLQGKDFFHQVDNLSAHEHLTLESRLTPEGLAFLNSQDISADLTKSSDFPLMSDAKIYKVKSIAPSDDLSLFFSNSSKETLRYCLIPGPVTIEGDIPVLKERMTVNQGTYIHTDHGSALKFSPCDLIAPRAKIIAINDGVIELDPEVWVGAGATILADGRKIKIERGSIIASGVKITGDVPKWSIVRTGGEIIGNIGEKDIISSLPTKWIDPVVYYESFAKNSAVAREMSLEERIEYIQKLL